MKFLIKYLKRPIAISIPYMEVNGKGNSLDGVFKVGLADRRVIDKDGGT